MAGQFVLEGGRARVEGETDQNRREVFDEYVEPVKFVHNVFFNIDGTAEVWCELELGNEHDEKPIRIDEVCFGFNNIGRGDEDVQHQTNAKTTSSRFDHDEVPLLLESTGGDWENEDWTEMYDGLEKVDEADDYTTLHEQNATDGNDRMFKYHLGSGDNYQHIYTKPVRFDVDERLGEGNTAHSYVIKHIRKLGERDSGAESPIILPDSDMEEVFPKESETMQKILDRRGVTGTETEATGGEDDGDEGPSRCIDTISLWLYWEETDLCVPKDDISYHFRYAIDCDIPHKNFTHVYPHYILPEDSYLMGKALLMESLSENRVEEFHPPETRWMFQEWEEEYGVEDMSSARMTRSKEKNTAHVFNSGRIGFPALRARQTTLQFVLVILSGWAVQEAFKGFTWGSNGGLNALVDQLWPLAILPFAMYLIAKGHGPPPYFPTFMHGAIVPLEDWLFGPLGDGLSRLGQSLFGLGTRARTQLGRLDPRNWKMDDGESDPDVNT